MPGQQGNNAKPTVFITGGSSGIGEGLARAYHARGAKVIIGGRHPAALEAVADSCSGMETCVVDVADPASIAACAAEMARRFPALDVLVNNAGIQRLVAFTEEKSHAPAELRTEIDTNFTGLVLMTNAFLPLLKARPSARIVQVSSGLGFVPLVSAPIYSATKAAVHAFSVALRVQLKDTSVRVVELIPPAVETDLHRGQSRKLSGAMPLAAFIEKSMAALDSGGDELPIGLAGVLRTGSRIVPSFFLKMINKPR